MARKISKFASQPRPKARVHLSTNAERLNLRRFHARLRRESSWTKIGRQLQWSRFEKLIEYLSSDEKFLISSRETSSGANEITFKNCSFFSDPEEALDTLYAVAAADRIGKPYTVNFLDSTCVDLAPLLIFSLIRRAARPGICQGGKLTSGLKRVFHAIGLNKFGRMSVGKHDARAVWPIYLESVEIPAGAGYRAAAYRKQRTSTKIAREVNSWIGKTGYELTEESYEGLVTLLAELLDNSRHANSIRGGYEWTIAGFMTPGSHDNQYICYLSIINLGRSFAESLKNADTKRMRQLVRDYVSRHIGASMRQDEAALVTALALQDAITSDGQGGCGMGNFINMVTSLGSEAEPPQIIILSGASFIRLAAPYGKMHVRADGKNVQFFNADQDQSLPPSDGHVYRLSRSFPGTVISTRFIIDTNDLAQKAVGDADDRDAI